MPVNNDEKYGFRSEDEALQDGIFAYHIGDRDITRAAYEYICTGLAPEDAHEAMKKCLERRTYGEAFRLWMCYTECGFFRSDIPGARASFETLTAYIVNNAPPTVMSTLENALEKLLNMAPAGYGDKNRPNFRLEDVCDAFRANGKGLSEYLRKVMDALPA